MDTVSTEVAFTPSVKAEQTRHGSRASYERLEARGGWPTVVTPELAAFIAERDSLYIATANGEGQPYIQHRGGEKGFLQVLDERTLAFADLSGNRQYITTGNLAENPKAFLFLMDYEARRRIKLWGTARVVPKEALPAMQRDAARSSERVERVIIFDLAAWDVNCPRHIPRKYEAGAVDRVVAELRAQILHLEEENESLRRRAVSVVRKGPGSRQV